MRRAHPPLAHPWLAHPWLAWPPLRGLAAAGVVALGAAAAAPSALAHSHVIRTLPADGSVAAPPPSVIRMDFDHAIEARYSSVVVRLDGAAVGDVSPLQADPTGAVVTVTLPSPRPGRYVVEWKVLGRDGHRTQGRFGFEARDR